MTSDSRDISSKTAQTVLNRPSQTKKFIRVAIPSPLRKLFDYYPPSEPFNKNIHPGIRVLVPFHSRQMVGIVVSIEFNTDVPEHKLKQVLAVLDDKALLPSDIIQLCQWTARYYHYSLGETLLHSLPKILRVGQPATMQKTTLWYSEGLLNTGIKEQLKRSKKQLKAIELIAGKPEGLSSVELHQHGIGKHILQELVKKDLIHCQEVETAQRLFTEINIPLKSAHLTLNVEQAFACETIIDCLGSYKTCLLEGVTGSGKTEVYLQAIAAALSQGKQALVLVPEIGLTPQTVKRFRQRFNAPVACLHSGLNKRERLQNWLEISRGIAGILISTRSGIFTPMPHLGLIIVDEEHDISYKQQDGFGYNARDLAIFRGYQSHCPVVLGSATPSLETLHNAQQGKYTQLRLEKRAGNASPPNMELVDMRYQVVQDGLSTKLLQIIGSHLENSNQVLVFLNRRGYAPSMICHNCGTIIDCPNCDAHMTLHRYPPHLHCHHCDKQQAIPQQCLACQEQNLHPVGHGTERTEQILHQHFPNYPVLRIDKDTTRRKKALIHMLDEIHTGAPCILLGTQMLAKGHHFPNVTMVAILNADAGLFSSDFRASERTGQLITQVAGRAGRGHKSGQVVIQTYNAQHSALQTLSMNNYRRFAQNLYQERKKLNLPPEGHLSIIRSESMYQGESRDLLVSLRTYAEQTEHSRKYSDVRVLGPIPAPMEKRHGRYRWQLLILSKKRHHIHTMLNRMTDYLEYHPTPRRIKWTIDVDPQDMN